MTDNCIFCRIVAGKIPAFKLYEDDLFVAILDRFPVNPGHTLIIPKFHAEDIFGLCEKEAPQVIPLAQKVATKIKEALNPDGFNFLQNNGRAAGQEVFHYHMHVIPRRLGDGIKIHQGFGVYPAAVFNKLALYYRQHGVNAAESHGAYFSESKKQIFKTYFFIHLKQF